MECLVSCKWPESAKLTCSKMGSSVWLKIVFGFAFAGPLVAVWAIIFYFSNCKFGLQAWFCCKWKMRKIHLPTTLSLSLSSIILSISLAEASSYSSWYLSFSVLCLHLLHHHRDLAPPAVSEVDQKATATDNALVEVAYAWWELCHKYAPNFNRRDRCDCHDSDVDNRDNARLFA